MLPLSTYWGIVCSFLVYIHKVNEFFINARVSEVFPSLYREAEVSSSHGHFVMIFGDLGLKKEELCKKTITYKSMDLATYGFTWTFTGLFSLFYYI